jgi:hypothetical protein
MNNRLQKTFDLLEKERRQLEKDLGSRTEQALTYVPTPGKWSVLQILTHLLTSEKLSLAYMKKKSLGAAQLDNSGPWESAKVLALKISQRLPIRYNAPSVVRDHTPEALPLSEFFIQWEALRRELKNFLDSVEDKNVRKKIYKHPVAGRLDANQAMLFFREHLHHHRPQIDRLLNNSPKV